MRAKDLMTSDFDFISGEATVREALELMNQTRVHCLIVQPRDEYDGHGIITDRDIVYKVIATGGSLDKAHVHQVMTKPMFFVEPLHDIRAVARLLRAHKLTRAPVVEVGKIIGIVSITDIVRHIQ
ncbi:MAG: CBS domain-containing protein [Chloracidobacterium sp.]|uniref:CBS domain-containing protein n=1 Tax=Chloracidobacterium validum TaxID=2821543 RepID=A0ABX8B8T9_9BACT|nr:CBS domain-containing protein [Chloracidobacterium validum]QUW03352.1 CBS domain-containing protein [Chloracidobacterium validum]